MFDSPIDDTVRSRPNTRERIRRDGARLMRSAGERLVCAARRLGGDNGAGLAHACHDMLLDGEVALEHWPLAELIGLLRGADPSRDRQLARILDALVDLVEAIDAVPDEEEDV
jgi:hypothetical protein